MAPESRFWTNWEMASIGKEGAARHVPCIRCRRSQEPLGLWYTTRRTSKLKFGVRYSAQDNDHEMHGSKGGRISLSIRKLYGHLHFISIILQEFAHIVQYNQDRTSHSASLRKNVLLIWQNEDRVIHHLSWSDLFREISDLSEIDHSNRMITIVNNRRRIDIAFSLSAV